MRSSAQRGHDRVRPGEKEELVMDALFGFLVSNRRSVLAVLA
jgi:hypothetical protein